MAAALVPYCQLISSFVILTFYSSAVTLAPSIAYLTMLPLCIWFIWHFLFYSFGPETIGNCSQALLPQRLQERRGGNGDDALPGDVVDVLLPLLHAVDVLLQADLLVARLRRVPPQQLR